MTGSCHLSYEILLLIKRKGGNYMNIRQEKKAGFTVSGFKQKFSTTDNSENFDAISSMWGSLTPEKMTTLLSVSDGKINGFLGISDEQGQQSFNYLIGTSTDTQNLEGLDVINFPECDWLIFDCSGSIPGGAMINLKNEVLLEWLPKSDFDQLSLPRVEVYVQGDTASDSYQSELWIPVKNK